MNQTFNELFRPESIVLVGASDKPGSAGFKITKNLLEGDYEGKIYAVNPKYPSIYGQTCYNTLSHLPEIPDLVVFVIAPGRIPRQLEICGEQGIKAVLILSGGHRNADEGENDLEKRCVEICEKYGMRMLGSESFGIQVPDLQLNLTTYEKSLQAGEIAFISQSRAVSHMVAEWSYYEHIGFSYFISAGAMSDIKYYELIDWLSADFQTDCILIYMETLKHARQFLSAAREFTRRKPIVIFKAGKTLPGAEIIYSNRGRYTGSHAIFSAAFRRVGIIEVQTLLQLFNSAEAFGKQKKPQGNRLAIVTNVAAPALVAVDKLLESGGRLAEFTEITRKKLDAIIPIQRRNGNPVDLYIKASVTDYQKAVLSCLHDANTDAVLVIYSPTKAEEENNLAKTLVKIARSAGKTLLVSWISRRDRTNSKIILENGGLPVYHFAENAVNIFLKMYEYHRSIDLLYEVPSSLPEEFTRDKESARLIINNALRENRRVLNESETQKLLGYYGIPSPENRVVQSVENAIQAAEEIGYPVVLKVSGTEIENKTEVGGVQLNLNSQKEVRAAYKIIKEQILSRGLEQEADGILVEKMINKEYELFVSAEKHPVFGPAIKFGMGGVAYEIFDDLAYGLPPLNMVLAKRIIESTRIYKILKGYRGTRAVDIEDIQFLLCRFSYVVMDFPQIKSIGINPFAIDETGGMILNARMTLDSDIDTTLSRYHHLAILPYPEEFVQEAVLKNGEPVTLRPIRAEDEELERELLENLSDQSMYYRFFSSGIKVTHQMLSRFTNIDYDREIALVAEYENKGKKHIAGVVRLVLDPDSKEGEYAIAIRDDHHGQGLGGKMTDYILEIARVRNIKRIHATLLADNAPMLRLFTSRDFRNWKIDEETIGVEKFI